MKKSRINCKRFSTWRTVTPLWPVLKIPWLSLRSQCWAHLCWMAAAKSKSCAVLHTVLLTMDLQLSRDPGLGWFWCNDAAAQRPLQILGCGAEVAWCSRDPEEQRVDECGRKSRKDRRPAVGNICDRKYKISWIFNKIYKWVRDKNLPAGVHAVTHGKASAATRRQQLVLAVVVVVVPAFVAVMVPAVAMMLSVSR